MTPPIVGLFQRRAAAELAIGALAGRGFRRDQISVVRRDWHELRESPCDAGAGLGGLGALLVAAEPLAIPALGNVLAVGPLLDAVRGAPPVRSETIGGPLQSALLDAGCSGGEAGVYCEGVRRGGTLLVVYVGEEQAAEARAVLRWALTAGSCSGISAPEAAGERWQPLRSLRRLVIRGR